jgi:uncharacterized protein (TIGR02246 family)
MECSRGWAARGTPAGVLGASAGLLALLLTACGKETEQTAFNALGVKASLDSLWTRYATAADKRDSTALGGLFTEDASIVFSGAPTVLGRDAIRPYLRSLYSSIDATGLRVSQEDLHVWGTVAVQNGTFEEDYLESGREKTQYVRFTMVAERGEDGAWRIRRLIALADSIKG